MLFLLSSFFPFFSKISNECNSNSVCSDFLNIKCIKYKGVKGNFSNLTYIKQHTIHSNHFTYKSTGDNRQYPLSNAFDLNDPKSYWVSSTPNNDTFHNSITVEFNEAFTIEAILYKALIYNLNNKTRAFNGFPTKLRIYTSIDNKKFQQESVFVGRPDNAYEDYQFVLPRPTLIDKIKLEFVEVTLDRLITNGSYTPISCGITFLQTFSEVSQNASKNTEKVKRKTLATDITGSCGEGVNYSFSNGSLTIFGNGPMNDYETNPPYNDLKSQIETLVIMDGITSIGKNAFKYCNKFISITIPDSVTSIGDYAFYECSGLTSVTITGNLKSIGKDAFYSCSSLISITIPDGVTTIEHSAFHRCIRLPSIEIPDSVTFIGQSAFSSCSSLTSIAIPYSVTFIGKSAFNSCSSLQSIDVDQNNNYYKSEDGVLFTKDGLSLEAFPSGRSDNPYNIPDGVTLIGEDSFSHCKKIISIIFPDSVTSIKLHAFYGCSSLTSVTIANNLKSISEYAFYLCSSLISFSMPDSVTSIGNYAFNICTNLTSIAIPYSVTFIGESAFRSCSSLQSIDVDQNNNYFKSEDGVLFTKDGLSLKIFPPGRSDNPYNIPDGVTLIDKYSFYSCEKNISIIIPDSVTSIGAYAFYECSGLTSVTITNNLKSIGDSAFLSCKNLISFTIPDSVTSIDDSAFYTCNNLTSLTITSNLKSIGTSAFYTCIRLISITIPDGVTSIEQNAFYSCTSLTSIAIPDSVNFIGQNAFYSCSSLLSIDADQNSNYYKSEDGVLFTKDGLSLKIFPSGRSDNPYNIPDGVTLIDKYSFNSCKKLISIIIPDSVTSIGDSAFSSCSNLEFMLYKGENMPEIASSALSSTSKLSYVSVFDYYNGLDFGGKRVKIMFTQYFSQTIAFSNSNQFTFSSEFSHSNQFTFSREFSHSNQFTFSREFSNSNQFTFSNEFSHSNQFTFSNEFSHSNQFTFSREFSNSNQFTFSNYFSYSCQFPISKEFLDSFLFSKSNYFSESFSFSKSEYFSKTLDFSKSDEFTLFTESDTFIPKKDGHSTTITNLMSFSLTYLIRKSVSFSLSFIISNINSQSYTEDLASYIDIYTQSYIHQYYPYVIHYLSPSYVKIYVPIVLELKKKISPEQLIGVVCGATSFFFFILGTIILVIKKMKFDVHNSDDFYDISESDDLDYNNDINPSNL